MYLLIVVTQFASFAAIFVAKVVALVCISVAFVAIPAAIIIAVCWFFAAVIFAAALASAVAIIAVSVLILIHLGSIQLMPALLVRKQDFVPMSRAFMPDATTLELHKHIMVNETGCTISQCDPK
ncbi:hypothetical protein EWM64_g9102 [Hericium alpestre]|uniref:Uncharacterized protein n=1 Tax=Hericium alpestre TaxID=135208 RepID=A0A4Y9ZM54_9AGAM|nr:hypothetical protein EWM64_g9102 [Hericium alpestre]